ncbi:MAG: WhiB family transcriptional regulator [Acidimicrobiia bacterium]|nr:WhiB family transcriptional regulator [Acidimicrobiia bacterium]
MKVTGNGEAARAVCAGCPSREPCLEYAMALAAEHQVDDRDLLRTGVGG